MRRSKTVAFVFFAALLALGLTLFDDYGISWDETVQRDYGKMVSDYVTGKSQELLSHPRRHYGPVFQILLLSIERVAGLHDTRTVYLVRHLVTFIVFWFGVLFFYLLSSRVFKSWKIGLVGSALLVLSPRIFAHAFYNPKDIPLMSGFIISIYTLVRYLDTRSAGAAAVHAVASAVLIDLRVVGGLVPVITVGFVVLEALRERPGAAVLRRAMLSLAIYVVLVAGFVVLFWPTLWDAPVTSFLAALRQMAHYPWRGSVLYLGRGTPAGNLPWHYIPVWIAISTPVSVIVLLVCGIVFSVRCLVRGGLACVATRRNTALVLVWFLLPVGYLILSDTTLYDAWRQVFFVYPAILMLSVAGFVSLTRFLGAVLAGTPRRVGVMMVTLLVAFDIAHAALFVAREHPYQHLYFNCLAGGVRGAEGRFELDYWGLSYRRGLEYILEHDNHRQIKIYVAGDAGRDNVQMLKADQRARLVLVDKPVEANYYLTNFRWQDRDKASGEEFYSVEVGGVKILTVYRVRYGY